VCQFLLETSLAISSSLAAGGVNEKIEGFFDVCKARGLTGTQGVLIPYLNLNDLMLRKDVVRAVKEVSAVTERTRRQR
jgi:predicted ATP-dependent protease